MTIRKFFVIGAFFFFLLIPWGGENWRISDAITTKKFLFLKNSLAVIYYEPECKELDYWTLACHGLYVSPSLVVTTRHYLNLTMEYFINGCKSQPFFSFEDCDIEVFKVIKNSYFQDYEMKLDPQPGEKVYIPEVHQTRFFWKEAGKIEKVSPDSIVLNGFVAENGESGKPAFDSEGRLIGIVQGRFNLQKKSLLIPADVIKKCIDAVKAGE